MITHKRHPAPQFPPAGCHHLSTHSRSASVARVTKLSSAVIPVADSCRPWAAAAGCAVSCCADAEDVAATAAAAATAESDLWPPPHVPLISCCSTRAASPATFLLHSWSREPAARQHSMSARSAAAAMPLAAGPLRTACCVPASLTRSSSSVSVMRCIQKQLFVSKLRLFHPRGSKPLPGLPPDREPAVPVVLEPAACASMDICMPASASRRLWASACETCGHPSRIAQSSAAVLRKKQVLSSRTQR